MVERLLDEGEAELLDRLGRCLDIALDLLQREGDRRALVPIGLAVDGVEGEAQALSLIHIFNYARPEYFTQEFTLFPVWPRFDPERALRLFAITMAILLAPKLFGLLLTLFNTCLLYTSRCV